MTKEELKIQFIARATRHFDTPQIRKEAEEMFEKEYEKSKTEITRNN